jgi:uncharacterized protein (DUF924 family)
LTTDPRLTPADVIAFWREAGPDKWFKKNADFDRAIVNRFGALHREAAAGRLPNWAATPEGALALILIFDQFSRNMFRGTPKAFEQDELASAVARKATDAGFAERIDPDLIAFLFMPLMHSESITDQECCVSAMHAVAPHNLRYAREHERIIRRFGRFPHRNPILGRHMTPAEQAFIDGGGFAG